MSMSARHISIFTVHVIIPRNRGGPSRGAVHPIILGRKKSATMHIHIGILVSGSDCIYLRPNKMNSFSGLGEGHEALGRPAVLAQLGRNGGFFHSSRERAGTDASHKRDSAVAQLI